MALTGPATQVYFDGDGLLRKYGPDKATSNRAGEYKTYGALRELEVKVILGSASAMGSSTVGSTQTTDVIQSDQVFFPKGVFVEEVVVEVMEACNTLTSYSVGLVQSDDRTTMVSSTAFVNAGLQATVDTAGKKITLVAGSTGAGANIGTVPIASTAAFSGYITARFAGTQGTTGALLVRIRYRPNNP